MYYVISVYEAPDAVFITRCKTKDELIDTLQMGFNEDRSAVVNSMSAVREFLNERLPNYKLKRHDFRYAGGV